jgi:aspartate/methionine/tyrosine aminotransferase
MLKIHQYAIICAPIFSQYAALAGLQKGKLNNYSDVNEMRAEYDRRRKFMYKSFNDMGLTCFEPKGSFYVFPCVKSTGMTGEQFATALLEEEKVAVQLEGLKKEIMVKELELEEKKKQLQIYKVKTIAMLEAQIKILNEEE